MLCCDHKHSITNTIIPDSTDSNKTKPIYLQTHICTHVVHFLTRETSRIYWHKNTTTGIVRDENRVSNLLSCNCVDVVRDQLKKLLFHAHERNENFKYR